MGHPDYLNASTPKDSGMGKDDLASYFDKSASLVQEYTSRFEHDYARPALHNSQAFYNERPITATFLAIFSALSIFPTLSFLGIALFTITTFTIIALGAAFVASSVVVLGLLGVLTAILAAAFFTSAFLTVMAVSSYLFIRLVVMVRQEGSSGVSGWVGEIKDYLVSTAEGARPRGSNNRVPEDSRSDTTNESAVVVQQPDRNLGEDTYSDYDTKVQG
ncbi:hypothetical protein B0H34DRAFT_682980 [Crassisporium funariophilum]|nr:hypothetical protein B0H34DRAFT_682980 [Crassisporium funariophilum]